MENKKKLRKINFSKLIKISDTPHSISLGFSIGVFASFTPLIGVHIILAILLSWILKANYFSSVLGTFIGTPLTYPFIWFSSLYVGNIFIPIEDFNLIELGNSSFYSLEILSNIKPLIPSFLIGALMVGLASAFLSYIFAKKKNGHCSRRTLQGCHYGVGWNASLEPPGLLFQMFYSGYKVSYFFQAWYTTKLSTMINTDSKD